MSIGLGLVKGVWWLGHVALFHWWCTVMRVWYMLFAESPGFSPSREFSCFLPSPFVQLFCAQSGDPGGASASGQFSSDQEASKALDCTFLSFLLHTLRWPCLLFLLTYGGYGEKPFSSPSVCQIASRGELELKKNLVCDPSLRFSLCLSETFFQCVIWTISRSYM